MDGSKQHAYRSKAVVMHSVDECAELGTTGHPTATTMP